METPVPVIDLQDFPAQTRKLIEACEEWGCFRVINHGEILPASLMSEMKKVVKSLFDLPVEIKRRNEHVLPGSGYVSPTPTNPLYEAFGLYDMSSPQDVEAFCTDLDASPHQRETIVKYAKAVNELMREIGRKLGEGMGLKSGDLFEEWPCQFRINKYHFAPENVGCSGVQIHTDSGFLTVLQEDESVGGLEIMNKSGDFVAVDPCPGTLLLNLGDMAAVWSNGRFCNVRHRVMCKEAAIRVSIASFLLGPREAAIETPLQLLGSDRLPLYAPTTYEDLRKLRQVNNMHAGEVLDLLRADA
ncbi:2-oxoglutarate-dependent dioxygenase DAO-like [Ipomoea triloba]|uniref:2-oxoglutarate-dependent dioxygenase DAO-like n=1 Tax=Ipomoea triloba TaxID=35885 RepID=UPI00125CF198|nr:2-oxoglutarate-dependent dioxygenase DAO-like [Ipomoea triloba]